MKCLHALGLPAGLLVLAAKSNTSCSHGSLAGCLDDCVCVCVRVCVHACMGSWLTFWLAVLLSLDYLAVTGSLAYLLSGHLCGQARPLCPIQTILLLILTHTHTRLLTVVAQLLL